MKTSNFSQNIQKAIAFMFAATFAVSFTACTDDLMTDNNQPANNNEAQGILLEPYGLTYQNFDSPTDVTFLNADTTEISVSKALADKLGITTFVNHPLGIWHQIEQLPYARKATAEKLVGDRYILTVEPATLAELIGEKEVQLNTDLYVNNDIQEGAVTRAGGVDMPAYAAKYVDADQVIHPAVIHLTDPLGYEKGYHDPDEQAAMTRGASDDGCYDYIVPEQMPVTRAFSPNYCNCGRRVNGPSVGNVCPRIVMPIITMTHNRIILFIVTSFNLILPIFQDVARLTVQSFADGLECGETHGLRLARLQNREVRLRDADLLGQFLRRHLPPGHHHVYIHYDTHKVPDV